MDSDVAEVADALGRAGVDFALLFGSRADGRATAHSDVDVGYWGPEDIDVWDLRAAVPEHVDLVDLRTAPDYLAGRIACTGVVIVDHDPPARVRWQAETRKRHLDEQFRRERFHADFARARG